MIEVVHATTKNDKNKIFLKQTVHQKYELSESNFTLISKALKLLKQLDLLI
jgi:hypothetical protein